MTNNKPCDTADFAQWIDAARQGSSAALGKILEECRPYLLLIANEEVAPDMRARVAPSDLVQETYLEAQRDFPGFRGSSEKTLLAWLRQILLRNYQTKVRRHQGTEKRGKGRDISLGTRDNRNLQPADPHPTPSTKAEEDEENERLRLAIEKLPAPSRQAIELRSFDRLPFNEVGQRLGRSADAARKLWGRAVNELSELMDPGHDSGKNPRPG